MHSSDLRGTDFTMRWRGKPVTHAEFFSAFRDRDRVGVLTPHRCEALGGLTLTMAYVTAFYDRYRERSSEFFAYPDFFTFQRESPCADYCACDIWPAHKNVHVQEDAQHTAEAITHRGVNVLLVPDGDPREAEIAEVEQVSLARDIGRCFAYGETGTVERPDLAVECRGDLLRDYARGILNSVPDSAEVEKQRERYLERMAADTLCQTFRELSLNEALQRI
ncbi:MAG: hypothetical protein QGI83_00325 [Candidatus Latescibacteria bacterium]|jgi:hypothetical protein|nr:hypothetical protein [Candidatus Latescibacterota bacterium]